MAELADLVSTYWRQERLKRFGPTPGAEEPTKRKGRQMACPTCDHTMSHLGHTVGDRANRAIWWCPRCGTIRVDGFGAFDEAPKLVDRCREFEGLLAEIGFVNGRYIDDEWHRLGIGESIHTPKERSVCT